MTRQVLILGASGKIGRYSARAFKKAGWSTRLFNRQRDEMTRAARGCSVIVNGLNPQNYHDWKNILPRITHDVIHAARETGATVILPGNVYHYGDQGGIWSEKTLPRPVSNKGKIRLAIERDYKASGIQTIVLRAGNFIDPEQRTCVMSLIYLRNIRRNRITLPGAADKRQAMCYLEDWSRAAIALADIRDKLETFNDIPFPGHTLTGHDIKHGAENVLNKKLRFTRFPWWFFTVTSPVWELAREMNEMRYLYNTDHTISDERFRKLLPDFKATPTEDVFRSILS